MDTPFDINGDTPPPDLDLRKNSWTPAKYVRAVRYWITEIRKWQTGQAVIRAIQSNTVNIRPEPSTTEQHAHVDQRGNIRFTPMLYVRGNPPRFDFYAGNPRALNHNPDEVLLDEIVNAMLESARSTRAPNCPRSTTCRRRMPRIRIDTCGSIASRNSIQS